MGRGSRPGERRGGRQKGTPNKSTLEHVARATEAAKQGITPLEMMLGAARYHWAQAWKSGDVPDTAELEKAATLAKDAAPYVHPKLNSIEGNPANPLTLHLDGEVDMLEAARRQAFLVTMGARRAAKLGSPKPIPVKKKSPAHA